MSNTENAHLLKDAIDKTLTNLLTPAVRQQAQQGEWRTALWPTLVDLGLPLLLVNENKGGSGVTLADAFGVISALGQHAIPCPIVETLLANKLLADAGLAVSESPLSLSTSPANADTFKLATTNDDYSLSGTLSNIPWGNQVEKLVLVTKYEGKSRLCLVDNLSRTANNHTNLAGEPNSTIRFNATTMTKENIAPIHHSQTVLFSGALFRAVQMAGALDSLLNLSCNYAQERKQFGRPIGKFQAIQQQLALLASETTAARVTARRAFSLMDTKDAEFEIAAAKISAGRAASIGSAIAHQVHGAIGFTAEYHLQRLSRRLWSWREEFGNESYWAERLGQQIANAGADALWPRITTDIALSGKDND